MTALHIREHRKHAGLSQTDFADALGVSPRTVGAWERGENTMDAAMLCRVADVLGVTPDDILGWTARPALSVVAPRPAPDGLSADEAELLACYRASTPERRARLLDDARDCASLSKNEAAPGAPAALTGEVA